MKKLALVAMVFVLGLVLLDLNLAEARVVFDAGGGGGGGSWSSLPNQTTAPSNYGQQTDPHQYQVDDHNYYVQTGNTWSLFAPAPITHTTTHVSNQTSTSSTTIYYPHLPQPVPIIPPPVPTTYFDYSDAAPGYGTANHKMKTSTTSYQWFGSGVDSETSIGQDPEDNGFTFSQFIPGETGWIHLTAQSSRPVGVYEQIKAWVDWDQNKVFDSNECIKHQAWQVDSSKILNEFVYFTVPTDALLGPTWLRARITCQTDLDPTGYRSQGEVEDYQVDVVPEPGSMILLGSLATGLFSMAGIKKKGRK